MEVLLDKFLQPKTELAEVIISIEKELPLWRDLLEALPKLTEDASEDLLLKIFKVISLRLISDDKTNKLEESVEKKQRAILRETCRTFSFFMEVKKKIFDWSLNESKHAQLSDLLLYLYGFFEKLYKIQIPSSGRENCYNVVCTVCGVVESSAHIKGLDEEVLGGFHRLERKIRQAIDDEEKIIKEEEKQRELLALYGKAVHIREGAPPEDFRKIEIIPTLEELRDGKPVFLRPNKVIGGYDNADHYLDVQFRLLREDYVQPFRKSVGEFKKNRAEAGGIGRPVAQAKDNNTVRFYFGVTFNCSEASRENGKDRLFHLPSELVRSVNWSKSKRLLPGSLVMLTPDDCQTALFAITLAPPFDSKRKGEGDYRRTEISTGILRLLIEDYKGEALKKGTRYTMFECEAYFEAYKHNLKILQNIEFLGGANPSPMAKYIVGADNDVDVPAYFIYNYEDRINSYKKCGWKGDESQLNFNFKLCFENDQIIEMPLDDLENWDDENIQKGMALNAHQYKAFKMAMTSELAVIQGPPGTGKTYVGLQIVKNLLLNKEKLKKGGGEGVTFGEKGGNGFGVVPNAPFVILCYTNHALDQFLELLLEKIPGLSVVRVGGQCKSEKLERYSLAKIRRERAQYAEPDNYHKYKIEERKAQRHISAVEEKIARAKIELEELRNPNGVFNFKNMSIYFQLKKKTDFKVPVEVWNDIDKWLWIDWEYLTPPRFINLESMLISGFNLSCEHEQLNRQLEGMVTRWQASFVKTVAKKDKEEREDAEDYDMDELMEKRIVDTEREEEEKKGEEEAEYREHIYARYGSVRSCLAEIDKLMRNPQQTFVRPPPPYENKQRFLSAVMALRASGVLSHLPYVNPQFKVDYNWLQRQREGENDPRYRWAVYFKVVQAAIECAMEVEEELRTKELVQAKQELEKARERLFSAKAEYLKALERINADILRGCDVVGFTTTGAAKNHSLLEKAGARVVIIEEAAEILEAHTITALTSHCQHLILIGDHLQLRPSTTVYELGRDYRMNVSLFERMIQNGVPYCTLKTQHRMRPEISHLLVGPIYEDLINHESVQQYPPVKGVVKSMYFINHKELEDKNVDTLSKSNKHEASFLVGLCNYLLKQGCYKSSQITILTMYAGQMFLLKKLIAREVHCRGVRITCVDNYQGEENDIILLSLVRSNTESKLGFVAIDNRVCVALSRARHGMFVIGNMNCLCKGSKIWKKINYKLKQAFWIGEELELICDKHSRTTKVRKGEDFEKVKGGGCDRVCEAMLECNHRCPLPCHGDEEEHKWVKCKAPCLKKLEGCEHFCNRNCGEPCGGCRVMVEKTLPCGHKTKMECSADPEMAECKGGKKRLKYLACGHSKWMPCNQKTDGVICSENVDFVFPTCGHKRQIKCKDRGFAKCYSKCDFKLASCGHKCDKPCHFDNDPLHLNYKCGQPCEKFLCVRRHPCSSKHRCSEPCPPCTVVNYCKLPCGHSVPVPCGMDPANVNHFCQGLKKNMPRHKCKADRHWCKTQHVFGACPPCPVKESQKLSCGHKLFLPCHQWVGKDYLCKQRVEKRLTCGHTKRSVECHQPADRIRCEEMIPGSCVYCGSGPVQCGYKFQPAKMCQRCLRLGVSDTPSDPRRGAQKRVMPEPEVKKAPGQRTNANDEDILEIRAVKRNRVIDNITLD